MSLVVAAMHDDDHITMVADTKVTFSHRDGNPDEAKTRSTYFEALPKIVLLRADLMIGVTGDDPALVIEDLIGHRNDDVEGLLAHLAANPSAGFVVATLNPARLWSIEGGEVDERTSVRRAWSGDREAYDVFRTSWEQWPEGTEVPFLLSSSMQRLTSFDPVATVGGFTLTASTYDDGFRFQPWITFVGPSHLQLGAIAIASDNLTAQASVPPGGDATTHQVFVMPGQDPTRGALGLLIPETGIGLLFPHERPSTSTKIEANSSATMADLASSRHGQTLIAIVRNELRSGPTLSA